MRGRLTLWVQPRTGLNPGFVEDVEIGSKFGNLLAFLSAVSPIHVRDLGGGTDINVDDMLVYGVAGLG